MLKMYDHYATFATTLPVHMQRYEYSTTVHLSYHGNIVLELYYNIAVVL